MKVTVIDYGIGNVQSIINVLHQVNSVEVLLSDKREDILNADAIILPGVGAFKKAMEELKERNLVDTLKEYAILNKPFLGICLGMQLLFQSSEEFGNTEGLGILEGEVKKFPSNTDDKLPHISWNTLSHQTIDWSKSILKDISNKDDFYFVHSYICIPKSKEIILSTTEYGGVEFCSSVKQDNIYASQFHPEKSAKNGIKVINNFINILREKNE